MEIRHHFIRDSYEKKLIQVIKIHTDQNVIDLLTKAFDASRVKTTKAKHIEYLVGDEAVHKDLGDRIERATTTASSFKAEQNSGSGLRCQDTILGDVDAQTWFETTSKQFNDPPLSKVNTFGSGEDKGENVRIYIGDGNVCWIKIGVNTAWHQLNTASIKLVLLVKSEGNEDFHEIIDFLTSSHIYYALTECPTLYISLIEQFWQTAALSTTEDGVHAITATIDGRDKIITEASIRRHLKLQDSEGLSSLPNVEIFEQLARMGFIQILLNKQQRLLLPHTRTYSTPTLTNKLFNNMRRASKGYSGVVTPLFDTMLVQPQGEAPSTSPSRITSSPSLSSHHTPPSTPNTPPSFQTTHEAEETATMPHDLPLPGGHMIGS
ncbi:hypothetical protein Tco_0508468 [Tanacetum coccineum]